MITKKGVSKMSVAVVLEQIYEHQLHEAALQYQSKEDLQEFILEIFNKGILNDYLTLNR